MAKQLPAYFKEYLDERFNHMVGKILEVKEDVSDLTKEMKKMNGSVATLQLKVNTMDVRSRKNLATYVPQFRRTRKNVQKNRRYVFMLMVAIFVLGIVFLKESSFSIATIVSLFSGL